MTELLRTLKSQRGQRITYRFIVLVFLSISAWQLAFLARLYAADALRVDAETLAYEPDMGDPLPPTARNASAKPILDRNAFDSVTGPLSGAKKVQVPAPPPPPKLDTSDPLSVPFCEEVRLISIAEYTDPLASTALLQDDDDTRATVHRIGDDVGEGRVAYIGFNPRLRSPSVWIEKPTALCQLDLFEQEPRFKKKRRRIKKKRRKRRKKRRRKKAKVRPLPRAIAKQIKKDSPTEYRIERGAVDLVLEDHTSLMRSTRIVPQKKNGEVIGVRLLKVGSRSLLGTLGLKRGDTVKSVNGFSLASPEKALQAYARLRTASNIRVEVVRKNRPMTLTYKIQ